ncbi:MAG: Guanylate kinase kinase [Pseudomonadota bacterium]
MRALVKNISNLDISISHTTRSCRPNEKNGIDYHFVEEATFQDLLNRNIFLEHAEVFGHYYGTSRTWVEGALSEGKDVILEIDWQGAQQICAILPTAISIFILPPSTKVLSERLKGRHRDEPADIKNRLKEARHEISHWLEFDYLICNDDFDTALHDLMAIVHANRLRKKRQRVNLQTLIKNLQK